MGGKGKDDATGMGAAAPTQDAQEFFAALLADEHDFGGSDTAAVCVREGGRRESEREEGMLSSWNWAEWVK